MNGVAERMNRTIAEKFRSMLAQAKLPKSFWSEAVRTIVDLINLTPSRSLNGEIPDEIVRSRDVVFYEDQTIHDIQSKKPKTIMVHNLGGEIPQMNYDRDQPTQPNQMEQPD
ncbi:putative gag/pol polyprotein [Trifolium medium]|uniref:Putative gag/pol polyprotein n=1 Tax=Trifolium medium TaxID=97028 RepID=A0A392PGS5_9FABA|nr:putative gag/pol polyprotein [Trifolium medium]